MADPLSRISPEQKTVAAKIKDVCEELGVDPNFGLAIGWAENRFRTGDNPDSGAKGPMQVMPSNAKGLGLNVSDLNDVDTNIYAGCKILKENLDTFGGDSRLAAIAYNARPLVAKAYQKHQDESRLPKETQGYLKTIGSIYEIGKPAKLPSDQPSTNPFENNVAPEPEQAEPNVFEAADASISPESFEEASSGLAEDAKFGGAAVGATAGTIEAGKGVSDKLRKKIPLIGDDASPGQKWAAKTGYGKGAGYSVQEVARAYEKAKNKGKVVRKIAPGETLNINEMMKQQRLSEELSGKAGAKEAMAKASKFLGRIPLGSTMAGYFGGMDIGEAAERAGKGDIIGAAIKGVSGLGTAATLVPHPATRLLGGALALGAMPAEYIYQTMRENKRREAEGLAPAARGLEETHYDPMGNIIY